MDFFVLINYFLICIVPILSWNIETRWPIVLNGSVGSYFGFTVALHENSEGNFALISATKANSTLLGEKRWRQPGVLYKCNITSTKCEEVNFQHEDGSVTSDKFLQNKDDMWLGVSLDVQREGKGNVVACAHLWKDEDFVDDLSVGGACYVIDREFNSSSYKLLTPLSEASNFENFLVQADLSRYKYLYGQGGASVTFSEENGLVIGAPGCFNLRGTVISYNLSEELPDSAVPYIHQIPEKGGPESNAYTGYSVSFGNFFKSEKEQIVAGAPRGVNYKGSKHIGMPKHFDRQLVGRLWLDPLHSMEDLRAVYLLENETIAQALEGENVGDYFGASVLGIEINGDSYTDLVVGAPFYSLSSGGDEGKVYVYISNGKRLEKKQELMGSSTSESRFGTTIASVGDLDRDGYADIAIGAPYEDNVGAVYIYHGGPKGILPEFVQKIGAAEINPRLSGFGISISRGKDVDNNGYPDVLIGSYLSDKVFLLRSRPLVRVSGNVMFNPPRIQRNSTCDISNLSVPCFNVSFCLSYSGIDVPHQLDFTVKLNSSRKTTVLKKREYLIFGNRFSSYLQKNLTLKKEESVCLRTSAYITSDPEDIVHPIQMTLIVGLSANTDTESEFCKSCPLFHPRSSTQFANIITFDGFCKSDLNLKASVRGLSSGKLIVGEVKDVTLLIELTNQYDSAYATKIYISMPPEVVIVNIGDCREKRKSGEIVCEPESPLEAGNSVKYIIKVDTSLVPDQYDNISINVTAFTPCEELNEVDNNARLDIPLEVQADMTVFGKAEVEQIVLAKEENYTEYANISHTYWVKKYLPSTIDSVYVEFSIPTTLLQDGIHFLYPEDFEVNVGSSALVPAICNFTEPMGNDSKLLDEMVGKASKGKNSKEATTSDGGSYNYVLDCSNSVCMTVSCTAGPFIQDGDLATFRIFGYVNLTTLETLLKDKDSIAITTGAKVSITDGREHAQPKDHRPDEAKVSTRILRITSPPSEKMKCWILPLSIVIGLLLFIILLVVLIKMGYFRRKKRQRMKEMRNLDRE